MIRVLHMIGSLNMGGAQTMMMNLYRNIDRNLIQFDFILDHSEQLYFADEVKSLGGKIYVLPEFKGKNGFEIKKAWNNFFAEHTEYKVLHSHVRSYASIYIPIAKRHGVKTIIHSHSTSNGRGIVALIKTLMQYPLRYQADYFLGCSREAGEWLFGKKIVNSSRYFMLRNAIDTRQYQISESVRMKYRTELVAKEKTLVFIHVGRFHEAKNHIFLLEMFSEYLKNNNDSLLILIGDGDLRTVIENKIQSLNINNNIRILGTRNDVSNLLQAADCFLFPSSWEGLPVTVVEAQAAGLPCLISDAVTNDVNLSTLVKKIPINQGIKPWINAMKNIEYAKKNVVNDIIKAGFDIQSSAKWLSNFYVELIENV